MKSKILKSILAVLSCVCLGVGGVACGGGNSSNKNSIQSEASSVSAESISSEESTHTESTVESSLESSVKESSSEESSPEESSNEDSSSTEQPEEGIIYTLSNDGTYYIVTDYKGTDTDAVIASVYEDLPVTSIGGYAFSSCDFLRSVIIPDSVTSIGDWAFEDCRSLTSVVIPDSVTTIGDWAFEGCTQLTSTEYGNCKYLGNENNPYLAFIKTASDDYSSYTIHTDTKIIASLAFEGCTSLTGVVIPDGVTSIGSYAFFNCTSLASVEIPDSVTLLGTFAFYYCDSLASVEIPDGITSIGAFAFYHCISLTSVVIGDSVMTIGDDAFCYCDSLTSVYYKGTAEEWSAISIEADNNDKLTSATRYYYIENEADVPASGNYWHYDANGEIAVW